MSSEQKPPKSIKDNETRDHYKKTGSQSQSQDIDVDAVARKIQNEEARDRIHEIELGKMDQLVEERKRRKFEERAKALQAEQQSKEAELSIQDLNRKLMEKKAQEEQQQAASQGQATGGESYIDALQTPEMAKAISEMPEEARDKYLSMIREMEFQKLHPDMYQSRALLEAMRGMSPQAVQQVDPIDQVTKTLGLVSDFFKLQQQMNPPPTQIAAAPASNPLQDELQKVMIDLIKDAVTAKLSPTPVTALGEEPGKWVTMIFDAKTNAYVPTRVTYEQYQEIEERRKKELESKEEKVTAKEERQEILGMVKEGIDKGLPMLKEITKGRGQPMYYPPTGAPPPTQQQQPTGQRTQSFKCANVINQQTGEKCNNVITFPIPPTQPIVTCPKCGGMWELGPPGQAPPPQAPPAQQVQQQPQPEPGAAALEQPEEDQGGQGEQPFQ